MPVVPISALCKADLRSLLLQVATPDAAVPPLTPAARRRATEWAIAAYFLDERGLTPEGRLVATKDPYFEATVTDWLIHFHLSSSERSLWKYVVYEFLPQHPSFTQDDLLNHCSQTFTTESQDNLKKSLRLILRTYTDAQALTKIKFLDHQKKHCLIGNPDLSNYYTVGYLLAKTWEQHFKARNSILVHDLFDGEIRLNIALGISEESLRHQLDTLAKHGIIEQRSIKPHLAGTKPQAKDTEELSYQIYPCWNSPIELLEKAYENDIATPNRPLVQSLADVLEDEDTVDFSQFLEWASGLIVVDGGSNMITRLVS